MVATTIVILYISLLLPYYTPPVVLTAVLLLLPTSYKLLLPIHYYASTLTPILHSQKCATYPYTILLVTYYTATQHQLAADSPLRLYLLHSQCSRHYWAHLCLTGPGGGKDEGEHCRADIIAALFALVCCCCTVLFLGGMRWVAAANLLCM